MPDTHPLTTRAPTGARCRSRCLVCDRRDCPGCCATCASPDCPHNRRPRIARIETHDGRFVLYVSNEPVHVEGQVIEPHTKVYFRWAQRRNEPTAFILTNAETSETYARFPSFSHVQTFIRGSGLDILLE